MHKSRAALGIPAVTGTVIKVRNFGPIKDGEVGVRPLTIFIGPNNSGKSYTALLLRTIYKVFRGSSLQQTLSHQIIREVSEAKKIDINEEFVMPRLMRALSSPAVGRILSRRLKEELIGSFGIETPDSLIRQSASKAEIEFQSDRFLCKISLARRSVQVGVVWNEEAIRKLVSQSLKEGSTYYRMKGVELVENVADDVTLGLLNERLQFLPAARSGISQSYRVITASLLREVPLLPLRRREMPVLSSPIGDFMSQLISLERGRRGRRSKQRTVLRKMVQEFEDSVLHGRIVVKRLPESEGVDIFYEFRGMRLNLTQASSSVGELAPLLLLLENGIIRVGDILVLEEPEAHLHPAAILRIAEFLGSLVNYGIKLVLTSHSDFFLSAVNTLLKAYGLDESSGKGSWRSPLNPKFVRAFLFKGQIGESEISRLRITNEGISLGEFNRVATELQERHVSLSK